MEQQESALQTTAGTVMQGIQICMPTGVDFGRSSVAPCLGFQTTLTQPTGVLTLGVLRARLAHLSPVNHQRAHSMRGGHFTEKCTSGMSRPTPIAVVPLPRQLTLRGQSARVADRHVTTAGTARATRCGREGWRGGDLYGGGCPCSSTPCAGT